MTDNRLKEARIMLEINQTKLGEILNVSKQTISNWENGHDIIPIEKLIEFCNIFSFSIDYIMKLTDDDINYEKLIIDKKKIGENLLMMRKKLNLSQKDIAKECNMTHQGISKFELGKSIINTMTLYTICKNHKISADILLGRKEQKY